MDHLCLPCQQEGTAPSRDEVEVKAMADIPGYIVDAQIGEGSRGSTYRGFSQSDLARASPYCLKVCKRSKLKKMKFLLGEHGGLGRYFTAFDELQGEIALLRTLSHEHIIHLYEVVVDEEEDLVCLVTSFAPLGALMTSSDGHTYCPSDAFQKILSGPIAMDTLLELFLQITEAVQYLHHKGICHRDIKPDNLFLRSSSHLLLGDFGCARIYPAETNPQALVGDTLGTPAFWAPESLQSGKFAHSRDLGLSYEDSEEGSESTSLPYSAYLLDIWAMGVTLYLLLTGRLPFEAKDSMTLFNLICTQEVYLSGRLVVSLHPGEEEAAVAPAKQVLEGLLCKEPAERWSVQNVVDYLGNR